MTITWKPTRTEGAELTTRRLRISIHRHISYPPDDWFLSVVFNGAGVVSMFKLDSADLDLAKAEAVRVTRALFIDVAEVLK